MGATRHETGWRPVWGKHVAEASVVVAAPYDMARAALNSPVVRAERIYTNTVRALIRKPLRSGQGPLVSLGFLFFWLFSLGSRPGFLPPWPYVRVSVSVAVFLSTETSLYRSGRGPELDFSVVLIG